MTAWLEAYKTKGQRLFSESSKSKKIFDLICDDELTGKRTYKEIVKIISWKTIARKRCLKNKPDEARALVKKVLELYFLKIREEILLNKEEVKICSNPSMYLKIKLMKNPIYFIKRFHMFYGKIYTIHVRMKHKDILSRKLSYISTLFDKDFINIIKALKKNGMTWE